MSMQNTLVPPVRDREGKMDTSGYDIATIVNSSSSLMDQISRGTDEDELSLPFTGLDGYDETIDVCSFLLDTPYESDMPNKDVPRISKELPNIPDGARSRELFVDPDFSEMRGGVICCTLNTEVLEVPHNNNAFLLR